MWPELGPDPGLDGSAVPQGLDADVDEVSNGLDGLLHQSGDGGVVEHGSGPIPATGDPESEKQQVVDEVGVLGHPHGLAPPGARSDCLGYLCRFD